MKKINAVSCGQCGGTLEIFKEISTQGLKCTYCGWSVVTTKIPDARLDETKYEISCKGDYRNKTHVKTVSEAMGCNFLMARETLRNDVAPIFVGQAEEVLRVRHALVLAGLVCVVSPKFKWDNK